MRLEAMIKLTGILAGLAAAVFFGTLFYTENNAIDSSPGIHLLNK